jgi:hypothetical protein
VLPKGDKFDSPSSIIANPPACPEHAYVSRMEAASAYAAPFVHVRSWVVVKSGH